MDIWSVNPPKTGYAKRFGHWNHSEEIPRSEGSFRLRARHLGRTSLSLDIRFCRNETWHLPTVSAPCCRCCRRLRRGSRAQIGQGCCIQWKLLSSALQSSSHTTDCTVITPLQHNDRGMGSQEKKKSHLGGYFHDVFREKNEMKELRNIL